MKSAGAYNQMFGPALRFDSSTPVTGTGFVKVGSYYTNAESSSRKVGYGYGGKKAMSGQADIVDTAIEAGSFNTLVVAVQEAGSWIR